MSFSATPPLERQQNPHQALGAQEQQTSSSVKKLMSVAIPLIIGVGATAALVSTVGLIPLYATLILGGASLGGYLPITKETLGKIGRALNLKSPSTSVKTLEEKAFPSVTTLEKSPFFNAPTLVEYEKELAKDFNNTHEYSIENPEVTQSENRADKHNISNEQEINRGASFLINGESPIAKNVDAHSDLKERIQEITNDDAKTEAIMELVKKEHDIPAIHSKIKDIDQENSDKLCKIYNEFVLLALKTHFKIEVNGKEKDIFQFCDQSSQKNLQEAPTFYYMNPQLGISFKEASKPNTGTVTYHLDTEKGILEISAPQMMQFGDVNNPLRSPLYFEPKTSIDFINNKETVTWKSPTPLEKEETT